MWLDSGMAAIKRLRQSGVTVLGYTWFPLFTMINWKYRFGQKPVDNYRLELGLYRLGGPGDPRWVPTPLVPRFMAYGNDPDASAGTSAPALAAHHE